MNQTHCVCLTTQTQWTLFQVGILLFASLLSSWTSTGNLVRGPKGNMHIQCLWLGLNDALPVRELNLQPATFRLLARCSIPTELSLPQVLKQNFLMIWNKSQPKYYILWLRARSVSNGHYAGKKSHKSLAYGEILLPKMYVPILAPYSHANSQTWRSLRPFLHLLRYHIYQKLAQIWWFQFFTLPYYFCFSDILFTYCCVNALTNSVNNALLVGQVFATFATFFTASDCFLNTKNVCSAVF